MPNKKKKYSARFPPARIKKIMQKDDEVGKVAAAVPVIISRSLELFVESLIKKTNNLVVSRNARTLTPQHIKQTVLLESEFKFLHELVSTIPDVQCTEDEQPSSHLPHQPPLQEVSVSRPVTDHVSVATNNNTSSTSVTKPGGKQRGRPRKIKPEEMKQSRSKKPRMASTVEECDSEETCSGSEEENKESNDQSKQAEKASSSVKMAHYLPPCPSMPATLQNTILFNTPLLTGPKNHILNDTFPTISMELPKILPDAYMTLNGATTSSSLTSQQLGTAQHTPSNEEVLDLSTSGGKNGDSKVKKDVASPEVVGHQNLLQNNTVPRTFYMTNILNANVQTMSGPGLVDASMNQHHNEAYKLNIPKISVQKAGQSLIRPDMMSPGALAQGSRPSLSQPLQNFDQARPVGSPPAITYQIQNLAQKSHQIIFSQMRPEVSQNITTDAQLFNATSPVRLLQYPRFVSLVPGTQFGGIKSPNSTSSTGLKAGPPNEDSKLNPQADDCTTRDSANESQS